MPVTIYTAWHVCPQRYPLIIAALRFLSASSYTDSFVRRNGYLRTSPELLCFLFSSFIRFFVSSLVSDVSFLVSVFYLIFNNNFYSS